MEWQPIETAPKDVPVMIFSTDARWPGVIIAICSSFVDERGNLVAVDWGDFWQDGDLDVEPTHWMPLPEPPNS